jgi:hypothetical protein
MPPKKIKKASTNKERQARRRKREKMWLKANGWRSWEALHTALLNGSLLIMSNATEVTPVLDDGKLLFSQIADKLYESIE